MKPSTVIALHREEIRRIVEARKGLNPRVFGSTLHGDETEQSDLDILIDAEPGLNLIDVVYPQLVRVVGSFLVNCSCEAIYKSCAVCSYGAPV